VLCSNSSTSVEICPAVATTLADLPRSGYVCFRLTQAAFGDEFRDDDACGRLPEYISVPRAAQRLLQPSMAMAGKTLQSPVAFSAGQEEWQADGNRAAGRNAPKPLGLPGGSPSLREFLA